MQNSHLEFIHRVNHTLPTKIETHTHAYDELTYFIQGEGTTQCGEKTDEYRNKTFAFYHATHLHDEDNHKPSKIIYLHFSFNIGSVSLAEGVFKDPKDQLLTALLRLRGAVLESSLYQTEKVEAYLTDAIITAAQLQKTPSSSKLQINWRQLINYIEASSHMEIDFTQLAAEYGYSYDRFRHLFREKFGVSPYAYLLTYRIESAKMLLRTTTLSITDIAYDCGFGSSSQFTNTFKERQGVLPSVFRKKQ